MFLSKHILSSKWLFSGSLGLTSVFVVQIFWDITTVWLQSVSSPYHAAD